MLENRLIRAGIFLVMEGLFVPSIVTLQLAPLARGDTHSLAGLGGKVDISILLPWLYAVPAGMLIVLGVSCVVPGRRSEVLGRLQGMIAGWAFSLLGLQIGMLALVWSLGMNNIIALPAGGLVFLLYGFGLSGAGLFLLQPQGFKDFRTQLRPISSRAAPPGAVEQNPRAPLRPRSQAGVVQRSSAFEARLEVLQSSQVRSAWIKIGREKFVIGRGTGSDLQLSDPAVSHQHAMLRFAQEAWFVQDQGSECGTYVNGKRVQATRLSSGDLISIGQNRFLFLNR